MSIEFNHTIINVYDKQKSATFITEILGLPEPKPFLHFLVVPTSNNVSLDFCNSTEKVEPQHYAFLVSDNEFDEIFKRIINKSVIYWADPGKQHPNEINHHFGGRGFYFEEPSGHFLEVITKPYEYSLSPKLS